MSYELSSVCLVTSKLVTIAQEIKCPSIAKPDCLISGPSLNTEHTEHSSQLTLK